MAVATPTHAFIDAQRYGALLVEARFTVYANGFPVDQPFIAAVSTGTFTVDRNSEFRRTGQITIELLPTVPPQPLLPINPESLLAPFGNELFIEMGIAPSGDASLIQWVPCGMYVIASTDVDDTTSNLTVTLHLYDRAWTIAQRALKNPYNFPATVSGNFVAEIQALLSMVWGETAGVVPLNYNIVPTSAVVPTASYNQGSDPWQAALDMAAAVGYELYFGYHGMLNGRPIPDPYSQPVVWNFTDDETVITGIGGSGGSTSLLGSPYSTPVEAAVHMTRDGIFNDIIIQGTGDANAQTYTSNGLQLSPSPILAEAADTNPLSPTFIGGGMGDVPNFVSSSLVTPGGAQPTADNDLLVALSASWQATIAAAPNPIFDVDDVITVTRPRVGLNQAYLILDTITHTFSYDDLMQLTGRVLSNQAPSS
jgi:hypothetical protein